MTSLYVYKQETGRFRKDGRSISCIIGDLAQRRQDVGKATTASIGHRIKAVTCILQRSIRKKQEGPAETNKGNE